MARILTGPLVVAFVGVGCGSSTAPINSSTAQTKESSAIPRSPAGAVLRDAQGQLFVVRVTAGFATEDGGQTADLGFSMTNPTKSAEDFLFMDAQSTLEAYALIPPGEVSAFRAFQAEAAKHQDLELVDDFSVDCRLPVPRNERDPKGTCGLDLGAGGTDGAEDDVIGPHHTDRAFGGAVQVPWDRGVDHLLAGLNAVEVSFSPGTTVQIALPAPSGSLTGPLTQPIKASALPEGSFNCRMSAPAIITIGTKLSPGDRLVDVSLDFERSSGTFNVVLVFDGDISELDDTTSWDIDIPLKQNGAEVYDLSLIPSGGGPSSNHPDGSIVTVNNSELGGGQFAVGYQSDRILFGGTFADVPLLRPGFTWSVKETLVLPVGGGTDSAHQTCGPLTT